jgi:putative membrane protein
LDSQKKALRLTNYFVSLPSARQTVLLILIISMLYGLLSSFLLRPEPDFYLALNSIGSGIFALAVPAFISSLAIFLAQRKLLFRRVLFLSFVGMAMYAIFYLVGIWLSHSDVALSSNAIIVGYGLVFIVWFVTSKFLFNLRRASFIFATLQLLFFATFFIAANSIGVGPDPLDTVVRFYFASLVFLVGVYAIFYFINAPMKRNLGISGVEAIALFFSQWFYGGQGLEDTFEEIGEEAELAVGAMSFTGKSTSTIFLVPYVHFGPFGNLGGSEFSSKLSSAFESQYNNAFVFHGAVTHDFNPVSSDEFAPLLAAAQKAASQLHPAPARASIDVTRQGSWKVQNFSINDSLFSSVSRAPQTTEDLDYGITLALKEKAERNHSLALIIDEHNAETGDINTVGPGSPLASELLDAMGASLQKKTTQQPLLAGFASGGTSIAKSLGKNGIRVACFLLGKKLHAYLLYDANGITPDFRDEIIAAVKRVGQSMGYSTLPEVFTTDTHQINTVRGVLNPMGRGDRKIITAITLQLFAAAQKNIEPVKFAAASERFRMKVFGGKQSVEIVSTLNSIVAFLKVAAPIVLLAATAIILWALTKF